MMSQIKAPIYRYKKDQRNTHPYYLIENEKENIFYLANKASYDDLELNPVPTCFTLLNLNLHFELHFASESEALEENVCLFVCLFV